MIGGLKGAEDDNYCWLRIRIFGRKDDESADPATYPVEADQDDGSWYSGELKLSEEDLTELFTLESQVREYGVKLGSHLFNGQIEHAYHLASGRARENIGGRLRIQLWISPECSELHALKWERTFVDLDGKKVSLSSAEVTPFSRFTRLSKAEPKPIVDRPLKLLIAVANPSTLPDGFAPIDVEKEVENIATAIGEVSDLAVTIMPGRTGLSQQLRDNLKSRGFILEDGPTTSESLQIQLASHHILHYLGHGTYRRQKRENEEGPRSGGSYLLLEDAAGDFQQVGDEEIVARLAAFKDVPRLIFLSSCDTAKRDSMDTHPFVGLGPKLVESGFPAVVAMQDKVPMRLASRLTAFFYRNLLQHGLIDRAMNESRRFLLDEQHADWAIPVLFMRTPGGRLFAPNPVRAALRSIAKASEFQPRWGFGHLPLEAVLLTGSQQRASNWVRIAQQTTARVDLWRVTEEVLTPEAGKVCCLAISGERGTARSTHLRRLVLETAEQSLKSPEKIQVLPVYLDLEKLLRQPAVAPDLVSMIAESLMEHWPSPMSKSEMVALLEDDNPKFKFRVVIDNLEDLSEARYRQVLEELHNGISKYFQHHQFVIAMGHGGAETQKLPITHLLDVQFLSRRNVQYFLREMMGRGIAPESGEGSEDEDAIEIGDRLAGALEKNQLFDLAAQPWLLVRMVERAREEIPRISESEVWPPSRAILLKEVVEDKIRQIPRDRGMQARSLETMYMLAREMQFSRRSSLPLQEVIPIMAEVRGDREYGLEELLIQLIRCDLMALSGNESVRFLYSSLQAYCCAQALLRELPYNNAQNFWERITSSLGGINQVRWWFETLVLLCGLLPNPDELLEQVIYGESFAETEKVFLSARCLLESERVRDHRKVRGSTATETLADQMRDSLLWLLDQRNAEGAQKLSDQVSATLRDLMEHYRATTGDHKKAAPADQPKEGKSKKVAAAAPEPVLDALQNLLERVQVIGSSYVTDRVIEALTWRSSSVNEPRSYQRLRAIEELGRFRKPEVVRHLTRVAMERTRVSWGKELKFEYGGIRQAAGRALRRLVPEFEEDLLKADPALAELVRHWKGWKNGGMDELTALLRKSKQQCKAENIKDGIPAMAAFALGDIQTDRARGVLYETFLNKDTSIETRWAIGDSLTLLDPEEVMREVIYKLIPDRESLDDRNFRIMKAPNARWYEIMIYLIGQLRCSDARARSFVEKFLSDPEPSFALKGRAILALGSLNVQSWRETFEMVGLGVFDSINLDEKQRTKADVYLRIKALQALAEVGARETLVRLRSRHKDWPPEVERVFYVTSEEINWRLNAESAIT